MANNEFLLRYILPEKIILPFPNDVFGQNRQRGKVVKITYIVTVNTKRAKHLAVIRYVGLRNRQQSGKAQELVFEYLRAGQVRFRPNALEYLHGTRSTQPLRHRK